ncbi:tRNA-binding protein [soil metagenome]
MISWTDFEKVDLRAGTVVEVEDFPEARRPSYKLWIDFGESIGIKKTSAQLTKLYSKQDLKNRQVICVTNFPPRQIGTFMSEVLLTGFPNAAGEVVLASIDKNVPNGVKLF